MSAVAAYELAKALPNKLLNADGSITDFSGNIISPANTMNAEVFKTMKAYPNKFMTQSGETQDYGEMTEGAGITVSTDIFVPVDELPTTGEKNKIYLTPNGDGTFSEFYWNDGTWEALGEMSLDLSNYPTIDQMNEAINDAVLSALKEEY